MSRTRKAEPSGALAKALNILATNETTAPPSPESLSDEELAARLRAIEDEAKERRKSLDAEVRRRKDDADRRALAARREINEVVAQNAAWLVEKFGVEHLTGSCAGNEFRDDCPRCVLEQAKEYNWLDDEYRFSLVVEKQPLRDPDAEAKR